jgi:hypothetical protein
MTRTRKRIRVDKAWNPKTDGNLSDEEGSLGYTPSTPRRTRSKCRSIQNKENFENFSPSTKEHRTVHKENILPEFIDLANDDSQNQVLDLTLIEEDVEGVGELGEIQEDEIEQLTFYHPSNNDEYNTMSLPEPNQQNSERQAEHPESRFNLMKFITSFFHRERKQSEELEIPSTEHSFTPSTIVVNQTKAQLGGKPF